MGHFSHPFPRIFSESDAGLITRGTIIVVGYFLSFSDILQSKKYNRLSFELVTILCVGAIRMVVETTESQNKSCPVAVGPPFVAIVFH